MGFVRWIIALPILIGCFIFAVYNSGYVPVVIPTNTNPITLPLYIIAFIGMAIGFIFGAIILWLSMSKLRKERRKYKKTVKRLEKEMVEINDKLYESLSLKQDEETTNIIENNEQKT